MVREKKKYSSCPSTHVLMEEQENERLAHDMWCTCKRSKEEVGRNAIPAVFVVQFRYVEGKIIFYQ